MKDIYQPISETIEAQAGELWHCAKMIDKEPFNRVWLQESFTQAATSGRICLVALECVAAYLDASYQGVGKTPINSPDSLLKYSTAFYNSRAIKLFINQCHGLGVKVDYHVFLGDDDFVYSVDPAWSIQNTHISQAIEFQTKYFVENFPIACGLNGKDILKVHSSKQIEDKSEEIKAARSVIYQYIKDGIGGKVMLPGLVIGRLKNFLNWRKEIAKSAGIMPDENHLLDLALQELTSFAYQGHFAPLLAKEVSGENAPVVYVNTYPGHYSADDACMRLGINWVGLKGLPLGTIHPNIDLYNNRLAPKSASKVKSMRKGAVFTCGDPKGNPNF